MTKNEPSLAFGNIGETLRSISDSFLVLSNSIEALCVSVERNASSEKVEVPSSTSLSQDNYLSIAKNIFKSRRKRDKIFEGLDLFNDPAWDIVLDLFIARAENRRISVTSASLASQVPSTTALRWIDMLQRAGVVNKVKDHQDARRNFVELSDHGMRLMVKTLDNYHQAWAGAINQLT